MCIRDRYNKELLSYPSFYMSEYFDSCRDEYYLSLRNISAKWDWIGWIKFFLTAVISQATANLFKVKEIISLYDSLLKSTKELTHSQYFVSIVDSLFTKPVFKADEFISYTKTNKATAYSYLRKLEENWFISWTKSQRYRTYYFDPLLKIIK